MCAMFRNASHFPSEGSLGGLISGLSGALRQVGDAAASVLGGRGVRMDEDGQGPFEAAVQASRVFSDEALMDRFTALLA